MTEHDADRWDDRYRAHEPVVVGVPPDALASSGLASQLPGGGRALDLACGLGAQSLWLAAQGFDVEAVDVSSEAVRCTSEAVAKLGLGGQVTVTRLDLDHGIPESSGRYDVIVCQRFRAAHLYDAFVDRLTPGGVAIVTVLSRTGADDPGPFHGAPGELAEAFGRRDVEVLFHVEGDGEESIILHRWGQALSA